MNTRFWINLVFFICIFEYVINSSNGIDIFNGYDAYYGGIGCYFYLEIFVDDGYDNKKVKEQVKNLLF